MKKWETFRKNAALFLTFAVTFASCMPMAYGTVTAEEIPENSIIVQPALDAQGTGIGNFSIEPAGLGDWSTRASKWIKSTSLGYEDQDGSSYTLYTQCLTAKAIYKPEIPADKAGNYEVFYWAVKESQPFCASINGGNSINTIATTGKTSEWVSLGIYEFSGTSTENITLSSAGTANKTWRVGSVKLVKATTEPTPTPTPTPSPSPVVIDGEAQSDGSIWYKTDKNNIRTNIDEITGNVWHNGIRFDNTNAAGTGRAYINKSSKDTENKVTTNTYIEVSIHVETAGDYCLQFIGKYDSKYGKIQIDGGALQDMKKALVISDTGADLRADTAGYFDFSEGTHVIRLYHNGKVNNALRIDVVSLKKAEMHSVSLVHQIDTVSGSGRYPYGEKATVTADGNEDYTFAYWQEGDKIVSYDPSYTFTVTGDTELIAQFKPVAAEDTCKVVFKDINGVVLGTIDNVTKDSKLTDDQINAVQVPSKPGRTFERWDKDLTQTTVTQDTIVTAVYTKTSDTYTVSIDGTVHNTLPFDTKVTVTADAQKDGQSFSYWQEIGGKIVSYNPSYSFYVAKNINLTAVYGQTVVYAPVVTTMNPIIDSANQKMSFISQIVLPSGCEMIECGTLIYNQAGEFDLETTGVKKVKARTQTEAGQYMATLTGIPSNSTRYARGYLVYQITGESSVTAVYGDIVNGTLE